MSPAGLMLKRSCLLYAWRLAGGSYLAGLHIGLYEEWEEMLAEDERSEWELSAGAGEALSSLKGESLIPGMGEGEGEEFTLAGGDLESFGLLILGLSPADVCCCLACWRHLARRFLNQT